MEFRAVFLATLPIPDAPAAERTAVAARGVERFLRDCGLSPADATSRNPLETPCNLTPSSSPARIRPLAKGSARADLALHKAAREETAGQTEAIQKVEAEIDVRVAALYGL